MALTLKIPDVDRQNAVLGSQTTKWSRTVLKMCSSKKAVLLLYRQLLRKSKTLIYTDKDYYLRRIHKEFRDNQQLTDKKDIEFLLEKGHAFIQKNRLV